MAPSPAAGPPHDRPTIAPDSLLQAMFDSNNNKASAVYNHDYRCGDRDELGNLSPALTEVFLPHRAEVFGTYLQGCDPEAIAANLGGPFGTAAQELRSRGAGATLGAA